MICVAAIILLFAEQVSERVICGAAVILVFAEQVSVRVICGAAVILVFAEEVSVGVICVPEEGQIRSVLQECQEPEVSSKSAQKRRCLCKSFK